MATSRHNFFFTFLILISIFNHGTSFQIDNSANRIWKTNGELNQRVDTLEKDLIETKKELKETKSALTKLITTLLANTKQSSDGSPPDYEHIIKKRETSSSSNSKNDLLSRLPISTLLGLSKCCKDGKDGKDGVPGQDGKDGSAGAVGATGRDGRDGQKGGDGVKGATGAPGDKGERGAPGAKGSVGEKGEIGAVGRAGTPGNQGQLSLPGSNGEKGAKGDSSTSGGGVYTRWGRTTCGDNSTLIYNGFAAGTHYASTGGGANYQCLPPKPEYNNFSGIGPDSIISGAEYQSHHAGIFHNRIYDKNVPCARCFTNTRSAVMMKPAVRSCPSGWTKEYEGYLMTAYHGHKHSTTFECVDSNPEYSGSSANLDGVLFYFVKPDCAGNGSIHHCPPYYVDRQLTCVVCSR